MLHEDSHTAVQLYNGMVRLFGLNATDHGKITLLLVFIGNNHRTDDCECVGNPESRQARIGRRQARAAMLAVALTALAFATPPSCATHAVITAYSTDRPHRTTCTMSANINNAYFADCFAECSDILLCVFLGDSSDRPSDLQFLCSEP